MPGTPVELIKEKLDIVEFLRGYLTLQPAGKNFKGLCPFHKEKTPSFMVSPDRQSWHCFGCGIGGDAFAFLMRYENIEFGEALRTLAEKTGVELRRTNPAEYKFAGLLYDIQDLAKVFFKKQLQQSPVAKKYLAERGLTPETIEAFDLGWAPNEQDTLTAYFLKSGYSPDDLLRAGLSFKTERGMTLDRFRGRIMFPIENNLGKTVGFTGRILPQFDTGTMGKYVNSPESPIFGKSKLLYGYSKTKNAIRDAGWVFMVEGQMDCIMSYQAGVQNVVATSGTALTNDHLHALRRLTDRIVLSFDSDEAGLSAGERAIDLAEAADFEVKVALFDGYKDPGEAAQADPQRFKGMVAKARPAPEFYFDRYLPTTRAADKRDREYLKALRAVLGKLKHIASPVEQSVWFRELAKRTGIEERILQEESDKIMTKATATAPGTADAGEAAEPEKRVNRRELLTERMLSALVAKNDFEYIDTCVSYLAPGYEAVLELLRRGERRSPDAELDERLNLIVLRSELVEDQEIDTLKQHLLTEYLKDKRRELTMRVQRAEADGDAAALQAAIKELQELPMQQA
jgi:DNA primase